jgi:membrane-bound lytic murein transglycosylase D
MRTFILLFFATLISISSQAQITLWNDMEKKVTEEEHNPTFKSDIDSDSTVYTPEAWDTNWDSLMNSWYVKRYTNQTEHEGYNDETVPLHDSIIVARLSKLPNVIELPYNNIVRTCIDRYLNYRRNLVEYMLGLENFYFPMIEETLDKYGLPLELRYLTIIESALNPTALSRVGASGLWQFMLPTGKFYGLEINSLVDERRDPVKATDAACRYLKDLYQTYGDWNLAIAAYNCGAGNVSKAIKRSGGKKDYWTIYPYLPKETRTYLPFFIAANYVMNYYAYHQLYPVQTTLPLSTDTVMINKMIHFDQIAEVLQIDKEEIRALNPQYTRDIIPGHSKPQVLKLPAVKTYAYIDLEDKIADHKADELFTNRSYVGTSAANSTERIIYRVSKGETLASIGNKYGVSTASIRKWNKLKSNRITKGKQLILYVNNGGYPLNREVSTARANDTNTPKTSKTNVSSSNTTSNSATTRIATTRYIVKAGDSFYTIAQKFPGYRDKDLMKLNNTKSPALKAGQSIIVPKF